MACCPTEDMPKQDVLIAGGETNSGGETKSVEIFSWEKNAWYEISEMNESHVGASSFVYNNKLFVIEGTFTETIEN
jgi:N-acetylneuraminic acid mutarotase